MPTPDRCVVDTNVAMTANGKQGCASPTCAAACACALEAITKNGHLFIDDQRLIISEYNKNLKSKGEPGPGDAFLKWVLTNEWAVSRITRVRITPLDEDPLRFEELPDPSDGIQYDPSDRKFLAVSAAHSDHPPILQALDSKWCGWKGSLALIGVHIHFLCPKEIHQKFREKMER